MSLENRILDLAKEITACEDDGEIAVLADELRDLIRIRPLHVREKKLLAPLAQGAEFSN